MLERPKITHGYGLVEPAVQKIVGAVVGDLEVRRDEGDNWRWLWRDEEDGLWQWLRDANFEVVRRPQGMWCASFVGL